MSLFKVDLDKDELDTYRKFFYIILFMIQGSAIMYLFNENKELHRLRYEELKESRDMYKQGYEKSNEIIKILDYANHKTIDTGFVADHTIRP